MKSKTFFGSLVGSALVYIAMAACVATENAPHQTSAATMGAGGAGGMGNGGFGGFVDAMVDPVPDANAEPPSSGSRLKAKRYVADDGARTEPLAYWYDSKRNEDCYFQSIAGGTIRCAPLAIYSALTYYADSTCDSAALMFGMAVDGCSQVQKYVRTYESSGCASTIRIYPVTTKLDPLTMWIKLADGSCAVYPTVATYEYYAVGAEIPPTEFVAATLTVDP